MTNIADLEKYSKELDNTLNPGTELLLHYDPTPSKYFVDESLHAYLAFKVIWNHELIRIQEQVHALFLSTSHELICHRHICTGTGKKVEVDELLILAIAIKCRASGVIIAHNHPSGNLKPSRGDRQMTHSLARKCSTMGIELVDHLIISPHGWLSFRDEMLI